MAWATIRRATEQDTEALEAAAQRWCTRRGLNPCIDRHGADDWTSTAEHYLWELDRDCQHEDRAHYRQELHNWHRVVARALGDSGAEGIAYGHVGYTCEG